MNITKKIYLFIALTIFLETAKFIQSGYGIYVTEHMIQVLKPIDHDLEKFQDYIGKLEDEMIFAAMIVGSQAMIIVWLRRLCKK